MRRRTLQIAMLAAAAAMLTACSSSADFADLDREAEPSDRLPDVPVYGDVEIAADSSRLVGTHEGTQLWLTGTTTDGVCLLIYPDDVDWVAGCSDGTPLVVHGAGGSFTVISNGEMPPEGAVAISENVYSLAS